MEEHPNNRFKQLSYNFQKNCELNMEKLKFNLMQLNFELYCLRIDLKNTDFVESLTKKCLYLQYPSIVERKLYSHVSFFKTQLSIN